MAETISGSGGYIVPPPGYFERAAGIARKYGGLFISDEVQTAWGRTGDKWFGIEHWNVEPDMIASAKGMGNGAPVAVTIATPEVADKYPGTSFATFGGNPVSMAATLATLQVIEDDDLRTNAKVVGAYLRRATRCAARQARAGRRRARHGLDAGPGAGARTAKPKSPPRRPYSTCSKKPGGSAC